MLFLLYIRREFTVESRIGQLFLLVVAVNGNNITGNTGPLQITRQGPVVAEVILNYLNVTFPESEKSSQILV
jgi:hypothetical protein